MNAQQAENLRILIRHMETNVKRSLNMVRISEPCGTPACAIGEACMVSRFGLSFTPGECFSLFLHGKSIDLDTGAEIFGVTAKRLFGAHINGNFRPTPQEWAAEARRVLAENGYSMDEQPVEPKPDPFQAFMAKVQEPVAVEV